MYISESNISHNWLSVQHLQPMQAPGHISPIDVVVHRINARIIAQHQILEMGQTRQFVDLRKVPDTIVRNVEHLELLHHLKAFQLIDIIVADPELFEVFG